jgi:hypothetical protein
MDQMIELWARGARRRDRGLPIRGGDVSARKILVGIGMLALIGLSLAACGILR